MCAVLYSDFSYFTGMQYTTNNKQSQTGGTEYSFNFVTNQSAIPACTCKSFGSKEAFLSFALDGDPSQVKGFIVQLFENSDLTFANEEAIQLPAIVGDSVEGVLTPVNWSSSGSNPSIPTENSSET